MVDFQEPFVFVAAAVAVAAGEYGIVGFLTYVVLLVDAKQKS